MRLFQEGKILFATSYREDEIKCLRDAQPPHLLTSFAMWRNQREDKVIQTHLIERIGYQPDSIYVDCGSYTFRDEDYGLQEMIDVYQEIREEDGYYFDIQNEHDLTQFGMWWFSQFDQEGYEDDKSQYPLFIQYLNFLFYNSRSYDYCFAFDRIGDNQESLLSYRIMKALGLNVIPVYQATHIVEEEERVRANTEDFPILDYYAAQTDYIAIGGTAFSKVKGYGRKERVEIVQRILKRYPDKRFHLLGTLNSEIMEACPELYSFDGTTWLQKVKGRKIEESTLYLSAKMEWFKAKKEKDIFVNSKGQFELAI